MKKEQIKIAIMDDNIMIRSGLRLLLQKHPDFKIISESCKCVDLKTIKEEPNVLIIRSDQREFSRIIPWIAGIHKPFPIIHVLLLIDSCDDPLVLTALKSGVLGCLDKESSLDDLEKAVRELALGHFFIPTTLSGKLFQTINSDSRHEQRDSVNLPAQQMRILKLISQGFSSEEIAQTLVISKRTVDMHIYKLFRRLNVGSRTQAIQAAARLGLIDMTSLQ